jgi:hypothetical protein
VRGLFEPEARRRDGVPVMRLGATAGALDGCALTYRVDTRAGEGAGSSAAFLHRATMGAISLLFAVSSRFGGGFEG